MNTKNTPNKSRLISSHLLSWAVAITVTCLFATPVMAVDGTWDTNTTPASWGVAGNWSGSAVPGGAESIVNISKGGSPFTRVVEMDGDRTVGILNMGGGAHYTITSGTGGTMFFDNGGSNAQLNFAGSYNRTISAPIVLNSSLDIDSSGSSDKSRNLTGTITAGGADSAKVITNSANVGGAKLNLLGIISDGAGARVVSLHQNTADGTMALRGANTFSGGVRVTAGSLSLSNGSTSDQVLGSGTLTLDGGSLNFNGFSNNNYGNNTVISANTTIDLKLSPTAGDTLTLGTLNVGNHVVTVQNTDSASTSTDALVFGATTLTGNTTFAVTSGTIPMRLSLGALNGSFNLMKTGTGEMELNSAAGSYSGTTTLNAGSLSVGNATALGSGNLNVNGGLLNLGTVTSTVGAVTINSGTVSNTSGSGQLSSSAGFTVTGGAFNAILAGSGGLVKSGTGTATLGTAVGGGNTYTGATLISAGTLIIAGTASINASSGVTINGGTLAYNSSTNLTAGLTFTSGKIGGTNWNESLSGLTIGSGQTISPGNSPGTAATGSQTWAGSGSYVWEINNATGTAGTDPGWDLLTGTGALTLTATSGDKFDINVTSLTLGNVAGDADNFNSASSYEWMIADFSSAISTFDASAFNIDTSGFSNANTGLFSIARGDSVGGDNTELYLVYSAIPEPTTVGLLGLSLTVLVAFRRRRVA